MNTCLAHYMVSGQLPRPAASSYQPWASSPVVRRVMQGNRKRDTRPERLIRKAVHELGLRYRVAARPLTGRPWTADLVFAGTRLAVFIDGCYWHACPEHGTRARTNAAYWSAKLQRNVARDADTTAQLEAAGWTVLRFWEHENPTEVASEVAGTVRGLPR